MPIDHRYWSRATFRIKSEGLSIEDISRKLDMQPTRYHAKGEPYSKRNPNSKIREENLWFLESGLSDQQSLESHIEYFIRFLKERAESIKQLESECEFDIMCAYASENGQGAVMLNHKVLKELATYQIDLSINLYPPENVSSSQNT